MNPEKIYEEYKEYLNEALENCLPSEWAYNRIKNTHGIRAANRVKARFIWYLRKNPKEYQKLKQRANERKELEKRKALDLEEALKQKAQEEEFSKYNEIAQKNRRPRRKGTRWSDPRDFKGIIK